MSWLRGLFKGLWFRRLILAVSAVVVIGWFVDPFGWHPSATQMTLTEFRTKLQSGQVTSATINSGSRITDIILNDGKSYQVLYPSGYDADITNQLLAAKVSVVKAYHLPSWMVYLGFGLSGLLPLLALLLAFPLLTRQMAKKSGGGRRFDIPPTRLKDVGGIPEVVEELRFYVRSVTHREEFKTNNVRPPKGVLLYGPPGTGKTLLARAVAGEAGLPFYSMSGSEFVEMIAGVGAKRVRNLFRQAKNNHGAMRTLIMGAAKDRGVIIFIDEFDAVGGIRRSDGSGAANEQRQTVTQFLTELDGFDQSSRVLVFAATNRPDDLDPALRRPGRFDRLISVPLPDINGRQEILKLHMAPPKVVAEDVNIRQLAGKTPGFAGADLENLVNQAAIAKLRRDPAGPAITAADFQEALTTILIGSARKSVQVLKRDREITAAHEAGHTLTNLVLEELPDPSHVSIVPRGVAGGVTWATPWEEALQPRKELEARLAFLMGGRVGETLILDGDFTQGASDDLEKATALAIQMVGSWAMSEGMLAVVPVDLLPEDRVSMQLERVEDLLARAQETATTVLTANRAVFDALRRDLLENEDIDAAGLQKYKSRLMAIQVSVMAEA